jgi:26S proteasome non-ATPase regulatory subunit 10
MDLAHQLFAHHPPASTRVRDVRGQYPIHRAAAVGATPMVRLLLKNKSPLDATDSSGYTALHHAVAEGHGTDHSIQVPIPTNDFDQGIQRLPF